MFPEAGNGIAGQGATFSLLGDRITGAGTMISRTGIDAGDSASTPRIRKINKFGSLSRQSHALDYPSMASGTRNVRIFVSDQCFALMVDAMAAYSKKTHRFQTMRMTVEAACARLKSCGFSRDELEQFLAECPVDGDIPVWLEVTPRWSGDYDALREKVKKAADKGGVDKVMIPFAVHLASLHNLL